MYSGGKASWLAAHRVKERYGDKSSITLLFTDTKTEDADLYRFLTEGADALDLPLVHLADGRDIWQIFRDHKFLGNNRVPLCSRYLKKAVALSWIKEHCTVDDTIIYFGIDWTESHRTDRILKQWDPYSLDFPLLWEPLIEAEAADSLLAEFGIEEPRLYKLGAPHNNCGGLCVRAGHAQFKWALAAIPETYAEWESKEEEMRKFLDADVSILRDRRGGGKIGYTGRPITLKDFRLRVESENTGQLDLLEWGGCGCMTEGEDDPN